MTRDDIIRMAEHAGFGMPVQVFQFRAEELERFAAFVAAAEREACAELCEEMQDRENPYERNVAVLDCASAIRAKGNRE